MTPKELAKELRAHIERTLPLADDKARARKTFSAAKIDQAFDRLHGEVRALRAKHKLGLVRSARMLLELQRQLLDAGYAPDLVRKLVLSIMMQLFSVRK